jgi:uncharacterized protein
MNTETRDGMTIDWDVEIMMDDGVPMLADVFRPIEDGRYPVIISYGPYAKGLSFQEGYPDQWNRMVDRLPRGRRGLHQQVPELGGGRPREVGASRLRGGAGRLPRDRHVPRLRGSLLPPRDPGLLRLHRVGRRPALVEREGGRQRHQLPGHQPVARRRAPATPSGCHLRVGRRRRLVPGHDPPRRHGVDVLGQLVRHAGQDRPVRTGRPGPQERGHRRNVCGTETLTRSSWPPTARTSASRSWPTPRRPVPPRPLPGLRRHHDPAAVGGQLGRAGPPPARQRRGLRPLGVVQKWLELHGIEHWTHFYTDYGRELQLAFFDHFLKGEDNGWDRRPPVLLQVRHIDRFEERTEDAWPIPRTRWTEMYLHSDLTLSTAPPTVAAALEFEALGDGLTFRSDPLDAETEITGPLAARLWVSSSTSDADLFLVFRVFDPEGREVTFQGALDPRAPVAQGWLRASHRELDPRSPSPTGPITPIGRNSR